MSQTTEQAPGENPGGGWVNGNPNDGRGWNGPKGFWAVITVIIAAALIAGYAFT